MRELTPEEIKNAPDWATHYLIRGTVFMWESEDSWSHYEAKRVMQNHGLATAAKPIPHKEFDISAYEFSDNDILSVELQESVSDSHVYFEFKREVDQLFHSRNDIIAMAKSVKLTASDLS